MRGKGGGASAGAAEPIERELNEKAAALQRCASVAQQMLKDAPQHKKVLHAVAASAAALGGREGSAMTDAVMSNAALAGVPEGPPGSPIDTAANVKRPPAGRRGKELPQVKKLHAHLKSFDEKVERDLSKPLKEWIAQQKRLRPMLDKVHRKRIDREVRTAMFELPPRISISCM